PTGRGTEDVLRLQVELADLADERYDVAVVADPEDHVGILGGDLAEDRPEVAVAAGQRGLERLGEHDLLAGGLDEGGRRLGAGAPEGAVLVQQRDGAHARIDREGARRLGVLVVPRVDVEEPVLLADELLDAVEAVDAHAGDGATDPAHDGLEGAERL